MSLLELGITCSREPRQAFKGCLNGAWRPPRTLLSVALKCARVSLITVRVVTALVHCPLPSKCWPRLASQHTAATSEAVLDMLAESVQGTRPTPRLPILLLSHTR